MSEPDFAAELKNQIRRTGYPLEIETASVLESRGWAVYPTHYYLDMDEEKADEIDVFSFYSPAVSGKDLAPLTFAPNLLVECKKSQDHSLVLFTNRRASTFYDISGQTYDFPTLMGKVTRFRDPVREFNYEYVLSEGMLHYREHVKSSTVYKLINPNSDQDKTDIHEQVMKLIKAQAFDVDQATQRDKTTSNTYYPIFLSFLAIVFDGPLFEARLEPGDIVLDEINHGIIDSSYMPRYSDHPLKYQIDVVRKQFLNEYLGKLELDIRALAGKLRERHSDALEYLKRYGA